MGAAPAVVARPDTAEVETAPSSRRDLVTPAAIVLTLVPFVVLAVHMLRTDVFLSADLATTEMLTRDVGSHSPSLGPFSRDGWFHPGPALFYVLAPSYRLFGSDGSALAVGAVVINAVSVAAVGLLARRRGGTGLMLAALLGVAVLVHALGPTFLATPWNVYVTVLPYAALLFTIWAVVAGERWALPAATLLTSFLVQTHVGYVALALPLLAGGATWAVGAAVVDRRRRAGDPDPLPGPAVVAPDEVAGDGDGEGDAEPAGPDPDLDPDSDPEPAAGTAEPEAGTAERGAGSSGGLLGPLVVSAAIAVLTWLPPVVQQVTHAEGNVDRIVEWFREGDDAARTLLEGWRVVADQYTWPPEWVAGQAPLVFGNEPAAVYDRIIPILLLPVLAAAGYLWWRRGRPARALVATWILASAVAVVATSRTVGPLYAYRLHWVWALGMVGGVLVGWAAWTLATWGAGARTRQASIAVALAALAALTVATTTDSVRAEPPGAAAGELLAELGPETEAALAEIPGDGPVLVQMASFGAIGTGLGLVDELERAGVDAVVEDTGAGEHRNHRDGDPVRATLLVGVDVDVVPASRIPEHELIALAGTEMEQLEAEAAVNERLAQEVAAGTITLDDLGRVARDQPPPYSAGAVFLVTLPPGP